MRLWSHMARNVSFEYDRSRMVWIRATVLKGVKGLHVNNRLNNTKLMTTEQIHIIRQTFSLVSPMADSVAAVFYRRLFEFDPSLRAMFPPSLLDRGRKLM
jgi:hypothetical protein